MSWNVDSVVDSFLILMKTSNLIFFLCRDKQMRPVHWDLSKPDVRLSDNLICWCCYLFLYFPLNITFNSGECVNKLLNKTLSAWKQNRFINLCDIKKFFFWLSIQEIFFFFFVTNSLINNSWTQHLYERICL